MTPHPNAKEIALRRVATLREQLKGQPATDQYFAEKAAAYVGVKAGTVLQWMRSRNG